MDNFERVAASMITLVKPPRVRNLSNWWVGAMVLPLNKIRHAMQGYTAPRTFEITDYKRAVDYDMAVVRSWRQYLNGYVGRNVSLTDRTILELGPGADLGVGLILTMLGARKYNALDVNDLVRTVPLELYEELFSAVADEPEAVMTADALRDQLDRQRRGLDSRLNYVCDGNFDLRRFKDDGVDLVFSQAAFEHFDNVAGTVAQLSEIVEPGGVLIAEVDLSTHTRWIRDRDPLNIYRYPDFLYDAFKFRGSPNRLRPWQYKELLEENGWKDVRIVPSRVVDEAYLRGVTTALAGKFRSPDNDMDHLSVMLCATR